MDSSIVLFGNGASNYTWDNSLVVNNIAFIPIENSFYQVTGTDSNNCSSNSSVFIEIVRCYNTPFSIQIPNSFTPNFDGNNDEFRVDGTSFEIISLNIFNRWGQVIFKASNSLSWDGRLNSGEKSPEGTYYYLIEFKAFKPNGNYDTKIEKGTVSLFR
jgi:gliding motility-associated-like protein